MRSESWVRWAIGLVFGGAAGFLVLLGGAPFLALGLAFLALAFIPLRSVAFLSGALIGVGGLWFALAVRAQLACDAFDAAPNQGCQGSGVGPFVVVSVMIFGIGLVMGMVAWQRRTAQHQAPTEVGFRG